MAKELDLYNNWKRKQDKQSFQDIYAHFKDDIKNAAFKASYNSNLPQAAHKIYAANSFLNALRTYKPSENASLKTHVYGSVRNKANRLNSDYQNLGKIPESRSMGIGLYQNVLSNMSLDLGREPSTAELADELGWNTAKVEQLQKEVKKELSIESGFTTDAFFESNMDEEVLDYIYYELDGQEQVVYDYIFGKHGKPRMSKKSSAGTVRIDYNNVARATNFSASKVRSLVKRIEEKLAKALKK